MFVHAWKRERHVDPKSNCGFFLKTVPAQQVLSLALSPAALTEASAQFTACGGAYSRLGSIEDSWTTFYPHNVQIIELQQTYSCTNG